jgi:hypothetical protein
MMTFLPFADFAKSAASLDMRRLQNQRTEARFVLEWLEQTGPYFDLADYGAARMWRGFRDALALYYNAMLAEYERRGKTNGPTLPRASVPTATVEMPPWLGDERFHSSHRAVLLQKDAAHYGQLGWTEAAHAEFHEYLYPHKTEDGRWGLYPQSKYKKRTIVALVHGERIDGPMATAPRPTPPSGSTSGGTKKRSTPPAHAAGENDDEEDVPLSERLKQPRRRPAAALADASPAALTSDSQALTPPHAAQTSDSHVALTLESHAALTSEWERLTKRVLPQRAAREKWPIRFDHCFQRVALDHAFGGCWYEHLDRKKGAAIKQIHTPALAKAVAAARRMEAEGVGAVRPMDERSLLWRGKQPKRRKHAD